MSSMFFSSSDWQCITLRLSVALLVGGAIGFNRQQGGRPAGIRTFTIVSLGAALFVMIPLQIDLDKNFELNAMAKSTDLNAMARITQGVATGVGFLGAGMIMRQSRRELGIEEVKGLTSAATIWLAGGLGAAAGCGQWQMSLIGTLFALVVLSGFKKLKKSNLIRLDNNLLRETKKSDKTG